MLAVVVADNETTDNLLVQEFGKFAALVELVAEGKALDTLLTIL
jgi:hypothetical protein